MSYFPRTSVLGQAEVFLHSAINLETLLNILQEPYRTAIRLHCIKKYSYSEIARMLQLPEGTVKSHISRGRETLRILFGFLGNATFSSDLDSYTLHALLWQIET